MEMLHIKAKEYTLKQPGTVCNIQTHQNVGNKDINEPLQSHTLLTNY